MQHDLLRNLTIHQSNTEPIGHRNRLIVEIKGNDLPTWWTEVMHQPIHARLLSISTGMLDHLVLLNVILITLLLLSLIWYFFYTKNVKNLCADKSFSSSWLPLTLPTVEAVILNCWSGLYTIPQFIERMDQLKVLVVTNYGSSLCKLCNFHLLGN